MINKYIPKSCEKLEDVLVTTKKIGSKYTPWWHRRFFDKNGDIICEFLRLGHPQMMKKEDYINEVVNWIRETK